MGGKKKKRWLNKLNPWGRGKLNIQTPPQDFVLPCSTAASFPCSPSLLPEEILENPTGTKSCVTAQGALPQRGKKGAFPKLGWTGICWDSFRVLKSSPSCAHTPKNTEFLRQPQNQECSSLDHLFPGMVLVELDFTSVRGAFASQAVLQRPLAVPGKLIP